MSSTYPSMRLELRSAHVPGYDTDRLPLNGLSEDECHIHGELAWTIGERRVPRMGFWGPDDVCLGEWWDGLTAALSALASGQTYTLDSCGQGSPAFLFKPSGSVICLSIVAGIGGGGPLPEWQETEFAWNDMVEAVRGFKRDLRQLIKTEGPPELPTEWKSRFSEAE